MTLIQTYQTKKNLLAQKLTEQGSEASGSEGLTTLINKVSEILPMSQNLQNIWILTPDTYSVSFGSKYSGTQISLYIDNVLHQTVAINSSGDAVFNISNLEAGNYSAQVKRGSVHSNVFNMDIGVNIYNNTKIQLTSSKEILSTVNNESTTLTAKIVNYPEEDVNSMQYVYCEGLSVDFYDGDTLIGTGITDDTGTATCTFTTPGPGYNNIKAICGKMKSDVLQLESIYKYTDCKANDGNWSAPTGSSITFDSNGATVSGGSSLGSSYVYVTYNIPYPNRSYSLEIEVNSMGGRVGIEGFSAFNQSNNIYIDYGDGTFDATTFSQIGSGDVLHYEYDATNKEVRMYRDSTFINSWSASSNPTGFHIKIYQGQTFSFKNIKIKEESFSVDHIDFSSDRYVLPPSNNTCNLTAILKDKDDNNYILNSKNISFYRRTLNNPQSSITVSASSDTIIENESLTNGEVITFSIQGNPEHVYLIVGDEQIFFDELNNGDIIKVENINNVYKTYVNNILTKSNPSDPYPEVMITAADQFTVVGYKHYILTQVGSARARNGVTTYSYNSGIGEAGNIEFLAMFNDILSPSVSVRSPFYIPKLDGTDSVTSWNNHTPTTSGGVFNSRGAFLTDGWNNSGLWELEFDIQSSAWRYAGPMPLCDARINPFPSSNSGNYCISSWEGLKYPTGLGLTSWDSQDTLSKITDSNWHHVKISKITETQLEIVIDDTYTAIGEFLYLGNIATLHIGTRDNPADRNSGGSINIKNIIVRML